LTIKRSKKSGGLATALKQIMHQRGFYFSVSEPHGFVRRLLLRIQDPGT